MQQRASDSKYLKHRYRFIFPWKGNLYFLGILILFVQWSKTPQKSLFLWDRHERKPVSDPSPSGFHLPFSWQNPRIIRSLLILDRLGLSSFSICCLIVKPHPSSSKTAMSWPLLSRQEDTDHHLNEFSKLGHNHLLWRIIPKEIKLGWPFLFNCFRETLWQLWALMATNFCCKKIFTSWFHSLNCYK